MKMPPKALTAAAIAVAALLAGCANAGAIDPTTTPPPPTSDISATAPSSTPSSSSSATSPLTSKPTTPPSSRPAPTSSAPPKTSTAPPAKTTTTAAPSIPPVAQRYPVTILSSLKGADRAAAETAVKVYQGMMDTSDQSLIAPNAKDWPKVMSKYMNDVAFISWSDTLTAARGNNAHGVGYNAAKGTVTAVQLHPDAKFAPNVKIRACRDVSNFAWVQDGKTTRSKPGTRSQWTVYVEKLPKYGWSIRTVITAGTDGKAVKCVGD